MQKYRSDYGEQQSDGSTHYFAIWMGGKTLSKIKNCRIFGLTERRMVYVTGEADTFFSIPAACKLGGKKVKGFLTGDDDGIVFHAAKS